MKQHILTRDQFDRANLVNLMVAELAIVGVLCALLLPYLLQGLPEPAR